MTTTGIVYGPLGNPTRSSLAAAEHATEDRDATLQQLERFRRRATAANKRADELEAENHRLREINAAQQSHFSHAVQAAQSVFYEAIRQLAPDIAQQTIGYCDRVLPLPAPREDGTP